jgi:hypothetical protein
MRGVLALAACIACGSQAPDDSAGSAGSTSPTIASVTVRGPASLDYLATATLTASVAGTGDYSPDVNWVVNSGGGVLSSTTGAAVQYTSPLALTPTAVQITAISDADNSKTGSLTIAITPAPPPELEVAGTYAGSLHSAGYVYDLVGQKITRSDLTSAQSYDLTTRGANAVTLRGTLGAGDCIVPLTLQADGTLVFAPDYVCSTTDSSGGFVYGVAGTWDYSGNLSFAVLSGQGILGGVYYYQTFTGHKL